MGVAFLAFEQGGFVGVGGVGVDDFEDPAAEDLERLGVEVSGLFEEVAFGLLDHLRVEVGGQVGQGVEDGFGLLDVHAAGGQGGAGQVVALEPLGEPHGAVGLDPGGAGGGRVPVGGRGRGGVAGQVDPVGVLEEAGLELGDLCGQCGLSSARAAVVSAGSIDHSGMAATEPSAERASAIGGGHPVRVLRDRCHDTYSSTAHRHPLGAGIPLWITGSGAPVVDGKWFVGQSQGGLRWSRQARPAVGERVPWLRWFRGSGARAPSHLNHRQSAAGPPATTR